MKARFTGSQKGREGESQTKTAGDVCRIADGAHYEADALY